MTGHVNGSAPVWFDPDDERLARAAWSRLAEPGDAAAGQLVADLGPVRALAAVIAGRGRDGPVPGRWSVRLPRTDPREDLSAARVVGARLVVPGDPEWPAGLQVLGAAQPFCLWVRGPRPLAQACADSVAIVGARAATDYGDWVARTLATGCADRGFTVVSGAAYGIDSSAHRAALAARGPTVAVLACGIDRAYPARNEGLIERIAMHGCVATEVPPGSAPTRWRFLERNRLTAAMTTATVVVEAAWRSGAIGTANRALEYGRPVGAVPGPVTASMSAGCHRLLRQGATCVTDVQELFELLTPIGSQPEADPAIPLADHDGLSPLDVRVLDALPLYTGAPLDRLAGVAGVEVSDVRAALGRLQLRQLAEQADGRWRRCRPGR